MKNDVLPSTSKNAYKVIVDFEAPVRNDIVVKPQ